jgi:N-methylhydantoinase B/oxoprolinase/acetone carboxylase alpha subunit
LKTNPVELELFRHLTASICDEMGIVLRKTSYSANIKERRDYSCALYDAQGRTVAMGDHMPVHLGAMPLSVASVLESCRLERGDVVILNDPFRGGTHLPDITAVCGVFPGGARKPAFYLANRAHHADVGGMSPGSMPLAREIYQEGIRIPPVHLYRGGELNRQVLDLILANVRTPVEREGDLRAQHMSLLRGSTRLLELSEAWGLNRVHRLMRALRRYSERMMRATLSGMPDGVYSFADALDDDGASGGPVRIAATVTLQGDEATIDFSKSAAQADGPVNANFAVTLSATAYVFRCLLDEEVPFTAGLLRPLRLIAPEGSVVNASPPAAMAAGNVETSQRVVDVVLGALAKAVPERIPAASSGTMNNLSLGGWDPFRQRPFAYYETIAGGMGASQDSRGLDAVHTHMTNSWNTPVEALEHQFPLRIRRYGLRTGSAGRGRNRGGEGVVREIEFLAGADVTILSDRRHCGPYGLAGGQTGKPGENSLIANGRERNVPGKATVTVKPGEVLRIATPGGGGYGPAE